MKRFVISTALTIAGFRRGTSVDVRCGSARGINELGVEVVRRSIVSAVARGLRITYGSGTDEGHPDIRWTVTLCGGTRAAAPCP